MRREMPPPCLTAVEGFSLVDLIWAFARWREEARSWAAFMYSTNCSTCLQGAAQSHYETKELMRHPFRFLPRELTPTLYWAGWSGLQPHCPEGDTGRQQTCRAPPLQLVAPPSPGCSRWRKASSEGESGCLCAPAEPRQQHDALTQQQRTNSNTTTWDHKLVHRFTHFSVKKF